MSRLEALVMREFFGTIRLDSSVGSRTGRADIDADMGLLLATPEVHPPDCYQSEAQGNGAAIHGQGRNGFPRAD